MFMAKRTGSKNHIAGKKVSGTHTSVIDGVTKILSKFSGRGWFVSVRAGEITTGKKVGGGVPFVSVKRHQNIQQKNTLTLTFKRSGVIQKIYVQVNDFEKNSVEVLADMKEIVAREWKGAELVDRI
jgi:hypothetical protein